MDRQIIYINSNPLDVDQLGQSKNTMIALGMALQAILGTGTLFDGLACTPTGPASLEVLVGPGSVYALENVDNTAYGSLAADTTHQIVKQGISLDTLTLSCPAPGTTGQSINYLIQAAYQDTDTGAEVLPYFNADDPDTAFNGPDNTGVSQNTVREGQCIVAVKAGVAATTGSQTTPAPDAGYTGLWVVTVANGQTTIVSGNIAQASGAPFITTKLTGLAPLASPALTGIPTVPTATSGTNTTQAASCAFVQAAVGTTGNIAQPEGGINHGRIVTWASNTTLNVAASSVIMKDSSGNTVKALAPSATINSASVGPNGMDITGGVTANSWYYLHGIYNKTSGTFAAIASLSSSVPSFANAAGYTYSAPMGVAFTDGSGHFIGLNGAGNDYQWINGSNLASLPLIAGGSSSQGNPSTGSSVTTSVSAFVPPIASHIKMMMSSDGTASATCTVSPNANYGGIGSTSNPPFAERTSGGSGGTDTIQVNVEILLEAMSVQWAQNGHCYLWATGFKINI